MPCVRIKFRAPHAIDALLDGVDNLTHWLISTQVVPAGVPAPNAAAVVVSETDATKGGDKCQG